MGDKLTNEELKRLMKLYNEARSIPVIYFGGVDISQNGWDDFQREFELVMRAHHLDPNKWGFDRHTGEITKRAGVTQ